MTQSNAMSTDNKSGEREAAMWRWRGPRGGWIATEDKPSWPSEPLFSLSQLEAVERERDEARQMVIEANNSLYGSHGYFHSMNGGAFDKYHLAKGIEDLKSRVRATTAEAQVTSLQQQVAELKGALEEAVRHFDAIRGAVESNQVVDKDVRGTAVLARDTIRSTLTREAPNE